jgi:UDP:flavonoid glycosyltransferase YjiC (YdhE family)
MNILLCSLGSHGDIHPYLALGRKLLHRGHAVTIGTSSYYRELIERHGIAFAPIRPEAPLDDRAVMAKIMDARRGPETVVRKHVMPAIRDTYHDLVEPAACADLLVSHVLTYAVPVLAEKTGKPWASTVLSPMVFLSAHDVPVLAPLPVLAKLRVLGPRINTWLIRQLKKVSRSWSQPVAALRRELGLPPGRDPLWKGQHSPRLVLAMFSPRFGPPQPDWPPNVEVTGFPFLDASGEPLEPELDRFVSAGERPPRVHPRKLRGASGGRILFGRGASGAATESAGRPAGRFSRSGLESPAPIHDDRRGMGELSWALLARGGGCASRGRGHHRTGVGSRGSPTGDAVCARSV